MVAEKAKRVRKTPAKTPALVPQPHGGALLVGGNPGNKGGPGRPPDAFRAQLAAMTSKPEVVAFVQRCLDGEFGPQAALKAYAYCTEQAHGKATQTTKVSGDAQAPLTIRIVTE